MNNLLQYSNSIKVSSNCASCIATIANTTLMIKPSKPNWLIVHVEKAIWAESPKIMRLNYNFYVSKYRTYGMVRCDIGMKF